MPNSYHQRKKTGRGLYLAALLLLFGGIAYLAVSGVSANAVYHLQVAEALALNPDKPVSVAIAGEVAENCRALPPAAPEQPGGVKFSVKDHLDPAQTLEAVYFGDLPELFAPGAPVILEGIYQGRGQTFRVLKLTTLCPSKYEEKLEDVKTERSSA